MSQRERLSREVPGAPDPNPVVAAGTAARVGTGDHHPLPSWEAVFRNASPSQQLELLALARRQGLLYAHQLPPTGNGTGDRDSERSRRLVGDVFSGRIRQWQAVCPAALTFNDSALDSAQREAVARALATPDLFLLQGLPGTGKSRVTAEVITQAAARGERVLFLSPTSAAIDRLLEEVGEREVLCPIRCLEPGEDVNGLSASVRSFTFAERIGSLGEHSLHAARRDMDAAERRRGELHRAERILSRLEELAAEQEQLEVQVLALKQSLARIDAEVEEAAKAAEGVESSLSVCGSDGAVMAELAISARCYRENCTEFDKNLASIDDRVAQQSGQLAALNGRLAEMLPLVEAKKFGRWWQKAWWRARFRRTLATDAAETEALIAAAEAASNELERQGELYRQKRKAAEAAFYAERSRLVGAEMARRRGDTETRLAAVLQQLEISGEKWRLACRELNEQTLIPKAPNRSAVRSAQTACRTQLNQAEEQSSFARRWVCCLEEAASDLPARLQQYVNLVTSTTTALAGDANFGDRMAGSITFDLLVLEGADQVTESEFLKVARRAHRWVLVGEPALEAELAEPAVAPRHGESFRGRTTSVPARSAAIRPGFFHRLWRQLHCDPRRLGYGWIREQDRLCCQLRPVPADQRQWVESERVADFPDIELRILSAPRAVPVLVEVVFPPSMGITQAKEYIYRQLEELPVRPAGGAWNWLDESEQVVLHFAQERNPSAGPVDLESGVREFVATTSPDGSSAGQPLWSTCRIEFDRKAGWHRQRAEEWVHAHLGLRDLGRTSRLDVPYRMSPELGAFLSHFLFGGAYRTTLLGGRPTALPPGVERVPANGNHSSLEANGRVHCFEFVPVPTVAAEPAPARGGRAGEQNCSLDPHGSAAGSSVGVKGGRGGFRRIPAAGAGLELDLTDRRHRDRLPPELRPLLPDCGFINYLEAQAVVRALEGLAANSLASFAGIPYSSADRSPQGQPDSRGCNGDMRRVWLDVAVMALYPAQAQLIRVLIRQSPSLSPCRLNVRVDVPEAFRERECLVGLLSLTRSHGHRAVPFGAGPESLHLGLTRARSKLAVFGDLGTLLRRSQWEGPLDHLDEGSSARERDLIAGLVRYAQAHGSESSRNTVREASGP